MRELIGSGRGTRSPDLTIMTPATQPLVAGQIAITALTFAILRDALTEGVES